jgi:two-component sensor histidine kinase
LLSEEMPEKVDVRTLMGTIVNTLANSASASNPAPMMTVEVEHLWLDAEQAVPLALIVNELLFNSLVHGRTPAGQPLRVHIQCCEQNEQVDLVVSDNGGGFGDENWRQGGGHGMSIVTQLAQVNLRGQFRAETRDGGVRAELEFKIVPHGTGPAPGSSQALAAAEA